MSNTSGFSQPDCFGVEFYRTESGRVPVEEFIDALDLKMQDKVIRTIGLLRQHGSRLGQPDSRNLSKGVFELRNMESGNGTRILYFFHYGRKVILTHGFVKKTRTTPPREIERALKYKADYERRHRPDG
jgi:phage-related protein